MFPNFRSRKKKHEREDTVYELKLSKTLKIDKMTYIYVCVLTRCMFHRMFHCPVDNEKADIRQMQKDNQTMHLSPSILPIMSNI